MNLRSKLLEFRTKIESLDHQKKNDLLKKCPAISGSQKGVWFKYRENSEDNSYNLGFLLKLPLELEENQVKDAALKTLIQHPMLRVFFFENQNTVHMIQLPNNFAQVDIMNSANLDDMLNAVRADYARPFDLQSDVTCYFKIHKVEGALFLSFMAHHIVVDGFSLEVIKNTFNSFVAGSDIGKSETTFFESIKSFNNDIERRSSFDFWEKYYFGFDGQQILWDKSEKSQGGLAKDVICSVPAQVDLLIGKYVQKKGCLPFSVFNLALSITMFATKGVSNFYVGSTLLNRHSEEEFDSVGMYINTIKIKNVLQPYSTLGIAIEKLDQEMLDIMEHGRISYLEMLEEITDTDAMTPFQVVLEYQRVGSSQSNETMAEGFEVRNRNAKFDISFFITNKEGRHSISIEYDSGLISEEEASRLLKSFIETLKWIVYEDEDERLVTEYFNHQHLSISSHSVNYNHQSLSKLIAEWASGTEDDLVILGASALTKKEFSGFVAGFAKIFAVEKTPLITIWTNRTGLDLAMMTGAWLANKKYIAVDKNWPKGRLLSLIDDLGTNKIFMSQEYPECPDFFEPYVMLQNDFEKSDLPSEFLTAKAGYLVYSSGTTGIPNGAIIPEVAILNLYYGLCEFLSKVSFSSIAMNALFSFDASVQQFMLLFMGKSILILDEKQRHDVDLLVEVLNANSIDLLDCTPSFLSSLFYEDVFTRVPSLKVILVGGEKLDESLLRKINEHPRVKFFNVYGPCECAVDTAYCEITPATAVGDIGIPLGNTTFTVVDKDLNIIPQGQSGELVIFGNSVGIGYLNREDLNQKKFIFFDNDLITEKFGYLTGDLGHISANGNIFIKGRIDDQIKRNGVRIELSEIIHSALRDKNISQATCYFDQEVQKLVLFVTPAQVDRAVLKLLLREFLPSYMIPDYIVALAAFPLNTSGKIDHRLLYAQHEDSFKAYLPEKVEFTRIQEELATIWKIHLKINHVVESTDFFEAGGNSLIAFKVLKDIRKVIKVKLNISQLFSNTTFSSLLDLIEQNLRLLNRDSTISTDSLIVPLKEQETETAPLFCIHAVGGSIGSYFKLAKSIRFRGAIYGVTGFADEKINDIETYSDVLLSQILKTDLSHGVWLLGWSFGGILSLTIARKLQDRGVKIKGIFLVDSFFSPSKKEFEANFGLFSIVHTILGKHKQTMDKELESKLSAIDLLGKSAVGLTDVKNILSTRHGIEFDLNDEGVLEVSRMASYHRGLANSFINKPKYLNTSVFAAYTEKSLSALAADTQTLIDQGNESLSPMIVPGDHYTIIYDSLLMSFINEKIGT